MRNIITIKHKLRNLRESDFKHMYMKEIGVLLWVLGQAETINKGIDQERDKSDA